MEGTGVLGNLTSEEEQKLRQIRDDCEPATMWGHDIKSGSAGGDIVLLKFLRAREFDVGQSLEMLTKCQQWRAAQEVDQWNTWELAPCFDGFDEVLPGVDVEGRPVLLSKFSDMDPAKVFGDLELFVRYRVKWMEQVISRLTFDKGQPEQVCQIHDYKNVSMFGQPDMVKKAVNASKDAFEANYPEFKGRTIFLNFPQVFAVMFKAFTMFFPAKTVAKFVILGIRDQYRLYEFLPGDAIPEQYGGFPRNGKECGFSDVSWRPVPNRSVEKIAFVAKADKFRFELRLLSGNCPCRVENSDGESLWSMPDVSEETGLVQGEVPAQPGSTYHICFDNTGSFFSSKVAAARAS